MRNIKSEKSPLVPTTEQHMLKGAVMMLSAALLFAILGLFIKILGSGYRVWDIAAYRFIGSFLILISAIFFSLFKRPIPQSTAPR